MIPPDHTVVERLVVRAPNWLGDAVLALPAMAAIRRHFAEASLTVAAPGGVAALFREETDVRPDQVLVLPAGAREATRAIRDGAFELGILLPNSFRSAWQLRNAGVPQRWGYATSARGWLLTRRSAGRRKGAQHHSEYYRELIRGFGVPCDDAPPRVTPAAGSVSAALKALGLERIEAARQTRLVCVAPGAAYGQAKQWPPARMAQLIARLVRERDTTCVLIGASHDRAAGREIESWLRAQAPEAWARVHDLIGRTDLGALVGIASLSRVCVSNDSGAMHVAAATGRPVVALFGPTDERATRPIGRGDVLTAPAFCRPCHLRDCPIDHRCMKRITVDMVFAAVSRHLAFAPAEADR